VATPNLARWHWMSGLLPEECQDAGAPAPMAYEDGQVLRELEVLISNPVRRKLKKTSAGTRPEQPSRAGGWPLIRSLPSGG